MHMNFYKQIGLNCTFEQPHEQIWTNPDVGTIHIYGSLDEIQCGTGDYTIPADLLAEFDYESAFLHIGIIYEGITYSLVNHRLSPMSHPSAFLAVEQSARWYQLLEMRAAFPRNRSLYPDEIPKE